MAFKNRQQLSPKQKWLGHYNTGRGTLIAVFLLTVISVLTTVFSEDGTYFVFSAAIPRFMAFFGMIICGKYEELDYAEMFGVEGFVPYDNIVLIVLVVFAFIITALYLVCWFLSAKGRKVGLIIGIVLFALDTLSMPFLFDLSSILVDLVIHVLALVYMIMGLVAIDKLKAMPAEEPVTQSEEENSVEQ